MVGAVLQRLFSDLQPRQREEKWLGLEQCLSALTGPVRRRAANICLGMTPLPPTENSRPHPAAEIHGADVGALI